MLIFWYILVLKFISSGVMRTRFVHAPAISLKSYDEMSCSNTALPHIVSMIHKWGEYKMLDAIKGHYLKVYDTWKHKNYTYHGEPVETFATSSGLRKYYQHRFGKNLVSDYFSKTNLTSRTNITHAFNLLNKLTKKKSLTKSKLCVLHLRMGDVIDTNTLWGGPYESRYARFKYVFPREYYVSIVKGLKRMNVVDIVITAVTYHFHFYNSRSVRKLKFNDVYLHAVEAFLKENGFRVHRRINCGLPDEDFIFMANADIFVQGGGSYSKCIAKMVKMNGGTVLYNRTFIKNRY